ncbi:MAG: sigma-70 family RNA polymerase sigma factor [Deltaproteobacteria bacterium]|nr:sigma-70 family RNA polymerase sigma factor [Deltaproteobacteria bacterium]
MREKRSSEQLMARVGAGDRKAASELVLRHQRALLNFFYRYTNDPLLAEDLTQETFLRIYRAAPTYLPCAPFGVWLFRIARNLCLNELKSRRYRRAQLDPGCSVADPEHAVARAQLDERVRLAVRQLPERQRLALVLRRFEGLSVSEVAQVMETTTDAVDGLMARAASRLRASLGDLLQEAAQAADAAVRRS